MAKSQKTAIKALSRKALAQNLQRMDRFRAFYFEGIQLKPEEETQLEKLRFAFSAFCKYPSRFHVKKLLAKQYELSDSQAYAILRDSIKLFGEIESVDKQGQRVASSEFYLRLAKMAMNDGDYHTAMACKVRADRVMGLFDTDFELADPSELMPPVIVKFSDDIETLKRVLREKANTIDITHEKA